MKAIFKSLQRRALAVGSLMLPGAAFAGDVQLDNSGGGVLGPITEFLQSIIDFIGGPGILAVVFISAVLAVGLWVMAPRQGGAALAWLLRAIVGAIVLFNIGILITWIQGFS